MRDPAERVLVWLIGASLAWLVFDFVYYGNTIALPIETKLVSPKASLVGRAAYLRGGRPAGLPTRGRDHRPYRAQASAT